jgi:hypothetical protein
VASRALPDAMGRITSHSLFGSVGVDLIGRRGEILRAAREQCGCRCDGVQALAKNAIFPFLATGTLRKASSPTGASLD